MRSSSWSAPETPTLLPLLKRKFSRTRAERKGNPLQWTMERIKLSSEQNPFSKNAIKRHSPGYETSHSQVSLLNTYQALPYVSLNVLKKSIRKAISCWKYGRINSDFSSKHSDTWKPTRRPGSIIGLASILRKPHSNCRCTMNLTSGRTGGISS